MAHSATNFTKVPNSTSAGNNQTSLVTVTPQSVIISMVAVCTFVCNLGTIAIFIKDKTLRKPFTLYILNLSVADFLLAIFGMTGYTRKNFFGTNTMPAPWCLLYFMGEVYFMALVCYATLLIGLDRAWSITFPHNHRFFASKRWTIMVCGSSWIFLAPLLLPHYILDNLYYTRDPDGCVFNFSAQIQYGTVVETLGFHIPVYLAALVYVYIYMRLHHRNKKKKRRSESTVAPCATHTRQHNHTNAADVTDKHTSPDTTHAFTRPSSRSRVTSGNTKYYRLFSLMTVMILVCWVPAKVYFTLLYHSSFIWFLRNSPLGKICYCLEYSSCLFTPFIYQMSLPELRKPVQDLRNAARKVLNVSHS